MECSARTCPFKIKLLGYDQISLVERIITSATREDLLYNHNTDFTQLTMEHTQLQTCYNELWKCYCALLKEKHGDSELEESTLTRLFDPHMHIPKIVLDSEPGSPFHNTQPFLGFMKPPPSKPVANLSMLLFNASNESNDGSTTEEDSNDMGSDGEVFKQEYKKRRQDKTVVRADAQSSKLECKLAVFINQMDRKYPSRSNIETT